MEMLTLFVLNLAALALRGATDPRQVIDALASTTRSVSDYLLNEVIERLPCLQTGTPAPATVRLHQLC